MRWRLVIFLLILVPFIYFVSSAETYAGGVSICQDTDNGISQSNFGNITYSYSSVPPYDYLYVWDVCLDGGNNVVASCEGANCKVKEYFCNYIPAFTNYNVDFQEYNCYSLGYAGCQNGACYGTAPTCSDGIQNGGESDVDCGGPCGATCLDQEICITSADCLSSICNGGVCQGPTEDHTLSVNVGEDTPGNHDWPEGEASDYNSMLQLQLAATGADFRLQSITFKASGSGNDVTKISNVAVFDEMVVNGNVDSSFDGSDTLINALPFTQDNGYVIIPLWDYVIPEGQTKHLLVAYYMKENTVEGETYTITWENLSSIDDSTDFGYFNSRGTSTAFTATKTIVSSLNCNPYFDTAYNEYRGCYPNDPNAPSYCPCPISTTDHCTNGIWDTGEGEEGVDCGSVCPQECGDIPECTYVEPGRSCEMDSERCNFEQGLIEICNSVTGWEVIPSSEERYEELKCDFKECNDGWFICDIEKREVSFCDDNGQWEGFADENYKEFCTPIIINTKNVKNILGETYNNTIVKYKILPGESSNSVLQKAPWWVWIVILVLFLYASYFSYKYYKATHPEKRRKINSS